MVNHCWDLEARGWSGWKCDGGSNAPLFMVIGGVFVIHAMNYRFSNIICFFLTGGIYVELLPVYYSFLV